MRDSRVQTSSKGSTVEAFKPLESAELRPALDAFRMTRCAALLLVILSAVVISHPAQDGNYGHIAASLTGVAIAVYIARGGRRRLGSALSESAQRRGMREPEARLHAEALLETLTRQEPKHVIERLPDAPRADPFREPVRELPDITITGIDRERLSHLLEGLEVPRARDFVLLDRELARAQVVPSTSIAPDVVTMNSRVRFADEDKGVPREVTLVYPGDQRLGTARVSVLSPVGSALLGLKVGQAIDWPFPDGHRERYRVLAVAYQPEAAGHFHL